MAIKYDKLSGSVTVTLVGGGTQTYPVAGTRIPEDVADVGAYVGKLLAEDLGPVDAEAVSKVEGTIELKSSGPSKYLSFSGKLLAGNLQKTITELLGAVAEGTTLEIRAKRAAEAKAKKEAEEKAAAKKAAENAEKALDEAKKAAELAKQKAG